jgi:hypothetical protein
MLTLPLIWKTLCTYVVSPRNCTTAPPAVKRYGKSRRFRLPQPEGDGECPRVLLADGFHKGIDWIVRGEGN